LNSNVCMVELHVKMIDCSSQIYLHQ